MYYKDDDKRKYRFRIPQKKNRKKKQKKNHKVSCKPSATIAENAPIGTAKKTEAAVLEEASRAS